VTDEPGTREGRGAVGDTLHITIVGDPPGLIVAGEIDESVYLTLTQRLAGLPPRGDVHVDLAGVEFCDLAGLRAIVCAAGPDAGEPPGRHVVLHAVPQRLLRILQILAWDQMPAVVFARERLAAGGRGTTG
jgi:ABC-type transporter Mla MlaB component